jgi:hypothetical protein
MQKSMSKSGMLTRSGFRKRSNSSLFAIGSMSVMRIEYATSDPAPDPAARPDGDAVVLREADEVPDDQEVAREVHLLDDAQLQRQPRRVRVAVDLVAARVRLLDRASSGRLAISARYDSAVIPSGTWNLGRKVSPSLNSTLHSSPSARVLQRLRDVLEVGLHLGRRLHEEGVVAVVQPFSSWIVFFCCTHIRISCARASLWFR